jgi:hypothetical protein
MGIRTGLALALLVCAAASGQTAQEIVRRSLNADIRNDKLLRNYTYRTLSEIHDLDSDGNIKATHKTLEEILYIGGNEHKHVLEKDGKPLPPEDAAKAQATLDRAVAEASHLSEAERARREAERDRRHEKRRAEREHLPEAFDFRIVAEPKIEDRDVWQINATPRGDYRGPGASVLRNMRGTLWIDKQDDQWVRVEAEALDTISIGWFLARVAKGTRLSFESARVNDELWAPKRVSLKASARLMLLRSLRTEQEVTYSGYRKFQSDSRLLPEEAMKQAPQR